MARPAPVDGYTQTSRLGLYKPNADGVILSASNWSSMMDAIESGTGGGEASTAFVEDFLGPIVGFKGTFVGGTHALQNATSGIGRLDTGAVSSNSAKLDKNGLLAYLASKNPIMAVRAQFVLGTQATLQMGMYDGTESNRVEFYIDSTTAAGNWMCRCTAGGISTSIDSGVPFAASTYKNFQVIITSANAKFYIGTISTDYTLVATITSNIPTVNLQPRLSVLTKEALTKNMDCDLCYVISDR